MHTRLFLFLSLSLASIRYALLPFLFLFLFLSLRGGPFSFFFLSLRGYARFRCADEEPPWVRITYAFRAYVRSFTFNTMKRADSHRVSSHITVAFLEIPGIVAAIINCLIDAS